MSQPINQGACRLITCSTWNPKFSTVMVKPSLKTVQMDFLLTSCCPSSFWSNNSHCQVTLALIPNQSAFITPSGYKGSVRGRGPSFERIPSVRVEDRKRAGLQVKPAPGPGCLVVKQAMRRMKGCGRGKKKERKSFSMKIWRCLWLGLATRDFSVSVPHWETWILENFPTNAMLCRAGLQPGGASGQVQRFWGLWQHHPLSQNPLTWL